jgi:quercetin dioxygenase-like cupin family protein
VPPAASGTSEGAINVVSRSCDEAIRVRWLGHPITLVTSHAETGSAYSLVLTSVSPGQGMKARIHFNEAIAYYLLEGNLQLFAGGSDFHLAAGESVYIPAAMAQRFHNPGSQTAWLVMVCAPGGYDRYLLDSSSPEAGSVDNPPPITARDLDRVKVLAHQYRIDLYPGPETFKDKPGTPVARACHRKDDTSGDAYCRLLAGIELTGGAFSLLEATLPSGTQIPRYSRENETEALFVLEGEIVVQAGESPITASTRHFFQFPPHMPRAYGNSSGQESRFLLLATPNGFDPGFSEHFAAGHS